jgi:predicted dehydrogenase
MRSGARAILHQSAAVHGPRAQALRLSGSEGTAWLDEEWGLWRSSRRGEPERVAMSADLALPDVAVPPHAGPFAARELPSFVRVSGAWSDAISGRQGAGPAPIAATFDDGLACQVLIEAARLASRSSAWVELDT